MNIKCKDCKYFDRGKWINGDDQMGGKCKMLVGMLKMTNSRLFFMDSLHVYESFGCLLGDK